MSNETKSVNYSSLIRYNNKLKPLVITDANVNEDKLTLKYLDNNTKELTLPSGGSPSFPTRSVTRIPTFFEIHFQIVQDTSYGMDTQIESKLNIPLDVAKDIIKIYSKSQDNLTPLGFTLVSDVTEGKANNDYDTVFLATVNCNPKEFYDIDYEIVVGIETSFGNFNLQTSPFMESINEAKEQSGEDPIELPETVPAQVITGSSSSMQLYASSGENKNRYIIKAVLGAGNFTNGSRSISNGTVSIRPFETPSASASFKLVLDEVEDDPSLVTFTETILP